MNRGKRRIGGRCCSIISIGQVLLAIFAGVHAEESEKRYEFHVAETALGDALVALAVQAQTPLLYPHELADMTGVHPVEGQFTVSEALEILLRDTRFSGGLTEGGTITVSLMGNEAKADQENQMASGNIKKGLLASASALMFGFGGAAVAQDEAGSSNAGEERDTIIVTAQKREQNIQDVPMSITAIGEDEIAERGLVGFEDYLASVPGVSIQSQGPAFNSIVLRGVSLNPEQDGSRLGPVTGVYFGETPISGLGILGNSSDIKLIDVERVEVLRGPQGTLYGAGAMGGVIRNVPKSVELGEFSGRVAVGYSNTARFGSDNANIEGVVNIPIVENALALRAVAYASDQSGYYKNVAGLTADGQQIADQFGTIAEVDGDRGQTETEGFRASLRWAPAENFEVVLSALNQRIEQDGWGAETITDDDSSVAGRYQQIKFPIRRSRPVSENLPVFDEVLSDEIKLYNATVTYDAGWAEFSSSTSLTQQNSAWGRDQTFAVGGSLSLANFVDYESEVFTEELRATSRLFDVADVTIGYFFEDRERNTDSQILYGGTVFPAPQFITEGISSGEVGLEHHAIFGEAEVFFTESLSVIGGIRWFDQKRSAGSVFAFGAGDPIVEAQEVSASDAIFKAGAKYKIMPESAVYAMWSEGFRLGSVQPPVPIPTNCDLDNDGFIDELPGISTGLRAIESDSVDNYEIGGKFALMGGRLRVDAAAYQTNWNNISANFNEIAGCGTTLSVGEARIRGAEFAAAFSSESGLAVDVSAAYVDAELTAAGVTNLGMIGDRLPGSAEFTARLGLGYDFLLLEHNAYIRTDVSYIGGYLHTLSRQEVNPALGDYVRLDINAGIHMGDVGLAVFAKNLTNEDALVARSLVTDTGQRLRPRTVGVQLSYEF